MIGALRYLLFLLPVIAFAEPLVSINNVNPLTSDVVYNVVIYPLDGNLIPVNQIDALKTVVVFAAGANNVQAQIPASTTPYKFVGLRIWYRVEKGTGIAPVYWAALDHSQAARAVPAGTPMACTYTAPALTVGDLTCAMVVVAPPPPPPPPVLPTRIDSTTGAAVIKDASGAVWGTLPADPSADPVAGQIGVSRNGVRVSRAVNYVIFKGGKICQQDIVSSSNRSLTCECWNGSWVSSPLSSC